MVERIASSTTINAQIENTLRLQKQYAKRLAQTSSNIKSETYQGIALDTNRILNLESDYQRITMQSENAKTALERSRMAYNSLGQVLKVGQSILANLNAAISNTGQSGAELQNTVQKAMDNTASALNVQIAGRYIFSGVETASRPVDLTATGFGGQTYSAPTPSSANTGYYQGDNFVHSVEAADDFTVSYGVRADNPAVEKLIRAYDLVRTTPADADTLKEAYRVLRQGLQDLAVMQAQVAQDSKTLDQRINDNLDQLNLIDNMIGEIKTIDSAETAIRLKELKTQLEASFSVTADLLKLKLSDYL